MDPPASTILELRSVVSTQAVAREIVFSGRADVIAVRADYQTAGRGRSGARWLAPAGTCLLVTYILPDAQGTPADTRLLSLGSALAVAAAIGEAPPLQPRLKWPNDVLLNGRKAAGVLIERVVSPEGCSYSLIGVGVNVNVDRFPRQLEHTATSMRLETGCHFDVRLLEERLRHALLRTLQDSELEDVVSRWRDLDSSAGLRYSTIADGGRAVGVALGIGESGGLILRLANGAQVEVVSATASPETIPSP